MRKHSLAAAAAAFTLLCPLTASAATAVFDFEGDTPTFVAPPDAARAGDLTSYASTVGGLTLTLTRPDSAFDIVLNTGDQGGKPAAFGTNSLDPFFAETSNTPFLANFSQGLFGLSIDFGDYGVDSPDQMVLQIWSGANGTGTLLGTGLASFAGAFPDYSTVSVTSSTAFLSATFIGGTPDFPHSVFYDNITATTAVIPEPGAWALMIAGFGGVGWQVRRRRRLAAA